jgi:hypothetical protein
MFEAYPSTLPLARDEIRLLRLLPGTWRDDILCELVNDTLGSVRPYHALSYVWGSAAKTKTILLDGHSFAVTVNLESTLRHLRSHMQETLLWVDALCINQTDHRERTHQVNLMGRIYQSSKDVLVYLGDGIGRHGRYLDIKIDGIAPQKTVFFDTEKDSPHIKRFMEPNALKAFATTYDEDRSDRMTNTVNVFSFIRTLSWVNHLVEVPWLASDNNDADVEKALLHIFESLRRFMHAPFTPWWGRIWVVQEVVLPPKVIIVCGTVSAPWTMFARAASQCLYHLHHCCSGKIEHLPRDLVSVLQDFGERVVDIDNLRKTWREEMTQSKQTRSETSSMESQNYAPEQRSLDSLLRRFRGRKASDPRDKVYALLSLVRPNSHRPPLMPNYDLGTAEVYTLAALESIYSSASLSVLTVDVARKYRQDLPTWVPDWEAPGDFSNNTRVDTMAMYNACVSYPVSPDTVTRRCRALAIEGLRIDYVQDIGEIMLSDSSETFGETMREWLSLKHRFGALTGSENADSVLWRVFCADVVFTHLQVTESDDVFRRMQPEDELMFVTWAVLSKRSPFPKPKYALRHYLSATAMLWLRIIDFEISILDGKAEDIGENFLHLFPEKLERREILLTVLGVAGSDLEQEDVSRQDHTRLAEYATLSLSLTENEELMEMIAREHPESATQIYKISSSQLQRDRSRAWKQVPWEQVLDLVRPILVRSLGSASKIGDIPYDVQVSLIDRSIVSATKNRRFFITTKGYVGLGPADTKPGDDLYLLKGGRTPFILRYYHPKDPLCDNICCDTCYDIRMSRYSPSRILRSCHKVIGDCYAHDFMDSSSVEKHIGDGKLSSWRHINLV